MESLDGLATHNSDNASVISADSMSSFLHDVMPAVPDNDDEQVKTNLAIVVDGMTLISILSDVVTERYFLKVATRCKCVLACRVSPEQKRLLVRMVKVGFKDKPVTMAIGDGANDVAMIQEAQIGVGISGREGRQAVNSSDFAIAQFRYLRRLLFIHGRTNYVRNCSLITFTLYKSYVLTGLMFCYVFYTNWTSENIFNAMVQSSYNVVLAFPVWMFGIFNKDVSEKTLKEHRFLYATGRRKENMNTRVALNHAVRGFVDIIIIFFIPFYCRNFDMLGDEGNSVGLTVYGTMVYTYFIIAMMVRSATLTLTWTVYNVIGFAASIFMECIFLWLYQSNDEWDWTFYGTSSIMVNCAPFWVLIFIIPVVCWYVDSVITSIRIALYPTLTDVGRALDRGEKVNLNNFMTSGPVHSNVTTSALLTAVEDADGTASVDVHYAGHGQNRFIFF
jgi:magnesium-transporting ATPase (P-type)